MKAFEKNIRKVEPYVPGEQPQRKVIKLNTNENPYPCLLYTSRSCTNFYRAIHKLYRKPQEFRIKEKDWCKRDGENI